MRSNGEFENFAMEIKINEPLEDNALRLLLMQIVENFNLLKETEMEKSPIIKVMTSIKMQGIIRIKNC